MCEGPLGTQKSCDLSTENFYGPQRLGKLQECLFCEERLVIHRTKSLSTVKGSCPSKEEKCRDALSIDLPSQSPSGLRLSLKNHRLFATK